MKRCEIASLFCQTPAQGTVVTVAGWARTVRDSKNIGFIALSDGCDVDTTASPRRCS